MKLVRKIFVRGTIEVLTGLHIGGSDVGLAIGGIDNPVVKDPITGKPYIPGSSLKGKMRSLLEIHKGKYDKEKGGPCKCGECEICELFGVPAEVSGKSGSGEKKILGRLIVRDAFMVEGKDGEEEMTEVKTEVSIDRLTSEANPRKMERVVKGAKFNVEFVIDIYEGDDEKKYLDLLELGRRLLNDDYLGGSGTRGYGKVELKFKERLYKDSEIYAGSNEAKPLEG